MEHYTYIRCIINTRWDLYVKDLISSNILVDYPVNPFWRSLPHTVPLKMGSTSYPHQTPGSIPNLQSLTPQGRDHKCAFHHQIPRGIFWTIQSSDFLGKSWVSWPARVKLDGFMGVGRCLYLWTCPSSWETTEPGEHGTPMVNSFYPGHADTLSLAVWHIFALCPAESWGAAGITEFFHQGAQQWPFSLVRS